MKTTTEMQLVSIEKLVPYVNNGYIEQTGSSDGVTVERDGKVYKYTELEVSDE